MTVWYIWRRRTRKVMKNPFLICIMAIAAAAAVSFTLLSFGANKSIKDNVEEIMGTEPLDYTEDTPVENVTQVVSLCIVDGADTGSLVLAGEGTGEVYTLDVGTALVYLDGKGAVCKWTAPNYQDIY